MPPVFTVGAVDWVPCETRWDPGVVHMAMETASVKGSATGDWKSWEPTISGSDCFVVT